MVRNTQTKRIKITSRGFVDTSRGRCRTPIMTPYRESINVILTMLSRDAATIIEVLDDGSEVQLNEFNFNKDNSKKLVVEDVPAVEVTPQVPVPETPEAETVEEVVEAAQEETSEPATKLTRKQRREMERKARQAAMQTDESTVDETAVEDSAISE